jgi:branched-chain amino acid transport system permease protein
MSAMTKTQYGSRRVQSPLESSIKTGLTVGAAALLISLVGVIIAFNARFIISDFLTTGEIVLVMLLVAAGFVAARRATPASVGQSPLVVAAYGALAGLVAAGVLALFVFIGSQVNLRQVLVNATPQLYELLTFERPLGEGIGLLLVTGLVLGLVGGGLFLLPDRVRGALFTGVAVVLFLGLLQDLVRLILNRPGLQEFYSFAFARRGLTWAGVVLFLVLPFLLKLGWASYGPVAQRRVERLPSNAQRGMRWGALALFILFLLYIPSIFGRFPTEVMNNVALLGVLMGLGLNIVVGFAGLLDLGYVGFFAIGAYTMALLSSPEINLFNLSFWQALPFALLVSLFSGIVLGIPVLKMRGDYLAIVTLGFGEIIRILVLSDHLRPYFNAAQGIVGIPNATVPITGEAMNTPEELYYLILVAVALTWFISIRLRDSRLGRAWMAVREDEDVAAAMGIDLVATKLMAFATGATMAGLGGAIFASKLQSIVPQTFNLLISINALCVIIIGGLASIPGVVIGALLLIGLPELLREFNEYRLWVYGALLVVMMLNKPEGFWPEPTRRRELHEIAHPEQAIQTTVPVPDQEPTALTDAPADPSTLRT